jgi:PAS domain S-box-containing protein
MTHPPSLDVKARHLAKVVESSDDAIVSKQLDGTITSWNRAAERMFGYAAEEAVGKSIRMIIPADRQSEEDTVLARIRAGEGITNFETVRQRKDGTLVPISLTVSPILDDAGNIIGASKIARDLTEKKRADIASRRLAAVVKSSDDAIITKSLDSIITSWNPAAERMFGYTEDEAVGKSIRMLIPAHLQSEEDIVLAKIRAGEVVDHYETVRQRKDGTQLSISLTVSPIRNEAGEIVGASKIARDVTERTRLQAAAREHAAITEKLGEVGVVLASTLDRATIVQKVTDTARDLTHAEFGEFFYNTPDDIIFTGDETVRLDDVSTDSLVARDVPFHRMPGHRSVRSYLAVPVKAVSGEVIGGLFFGHSRAGVFTQEHERLAEGIAAWASVALENARLFVEAERANRMKDEFLAVLSHELRTPLNAIVGYSRLLRGGILSGEKAAKGLETLERNATWLTQIVEDVLDVSRIVAGKIRLDVQPVDLSRVVDNAAATVLPAADAKRVRLETIIDPRVGPVSGDPDRLQQVVWNLVTNAVKFTPKNGRVQIRVERVDSHVEIVVSDTGQGIKPDFLPYVFERFRQAEAGTTREKGGLGLGLAIVRHIVEMHGGSVSAASEGEGKGSTFRVKLPLMIVHASVPDKREHPRTRRMEPLTLGDLRGIRVMAVDDEEDALTLVRVVLEAAGAEVETVSSPLEALKRIEEILPQVLIVDLGMPKMDGFELIAHVRASTTLGVRDVPAAALTAFARSEDRVKALRSGFEMHIAKPVDPAELVASVARLARRMPSAT